MIQKRTLYIRLLVLLSTFFSLIVLPVQAQSVFRIGVIDEEDGAITKGTRLAVAQINNSGGITGSEGTVYNLDVVVASPDNLQVAVANMNQAGVIAVVGPETTEQVLSSITVLQQLNVPIFTSAIGDTILLQDNTNRIFRSRAQEVTQGRALADYIVNTLNLRAITTIQLDVESTASVIGLSTALSGFSVTLNNVIYDPAVNEIENIVASISQSQPNAVGIYGPPALAAQVYNRLKSSGYIGRIIYNQAGHPDFFDLVPTNQLSGIINSTTWSFSSHDETSRNFVADYVATFGQVPNAIGAASYDAVQLIAAATSRPGVLANNIVSITDFQGVQGVLTPAQLSQGETSTNVSVTELNEFGIPNVVARYINNARIPDDFPESIIQTPTPIPSPTPDGFTAIIQSTVQNIRGGPSTDYDILGQLPKDTQVRVIGATVDYTWLVIDFRGQQGWLATYLVDTFGDRTTLPIIQPPPKPTPLPATAVPTASPVADLVIVSASPNRITLDEQFSVNVTVLNQGSLPAGPFGVATSFQPGGVYAGVNVNGLGGGQQTTVQFQQTITGDPGPQSIKIIADLNSQVDEGVNGEANNSNYTYTYIADRKIKNSGTLTINVDGHLNLEGVGADDVKWDGGNNLEAKNGAGMYLITGYNSINDIHAGVIEKSSATTTTLNVALIPVGTIIGMKTSDDKKGVMQVTSVTAGGSITLSYRAYE